MEQNHLNPEFDQMLDDAIDKGLIYFSNTWIEKAVQQKSRNMTIGIASSHLYIGVVSKESIN